jgi:peptidase E
MASARRATAHTATLIGGGPGTLLSLRKFFGQAVDETGADDPLVAYVGVASSDNAGFFAMVRGGLALTKGRMKLAKIASPRASISEARSLLEAADLVFVSGGDVELGMKILHDRDLASTLQSLARAGKPMFGISAGSLLLGREWVRFPDEEDEGSAELFPCLGIAPVHVDAHDEEGEWGELRTLLRLLHRRGDEDPVGYGLTRKGGLRVEVEGPRVELMPLGTDTPRYVVRRGQVVAATALKL